MRGTVRNKSRGLQSSSESSDSSPSSLSSLGLSGGGPWSSESSSSQESHLSEREESDESSLLDDSDSESPSSSSPGVFIGAMEGVFSHLFFSDLRVGFEAVGGGFIDGVSVSVGGGLADGVSLGNIGDADQRNSFSSTLLFPKTDLRVSIL